MVSISHGLGVARSVLFEAFQAYLELLKIMVPALLIVKLLQWLGAVEIIGMALSPLMSLLGLPDQLGIVWATALLTNVFTGVVVFFSVAGDVPLTIEQATVFGTLMLIGHALPVEGAVARRAGVPWWVTIVLRVGGALVMGAILHFIYSKLPAFQEPVQIIWQPQQVEDNLVAWIFSQINALGMIFLIILALTILLKLLRYFGLERWIHFGLAPLLRILGIGRSAANVTVIGVVLGLSYGAGLLLRDLDKGVMSRQDAYLALCFIGLVHSLIEDTLLVMALGADLSGILWARLLFSIVIIALLARVIEYLVVPE